MPSVTIDRPDCIACAACWTTCPEFFEEAADDGLSKVLDEYMVGGDPGNGNAPDDLDTCVRDAAESCPVVIIHVS